jgi:hypothetical protein
VAQLVDLLVDVGVLGDVGVGARDVGLRLIVVVVADEVLDGVLGEELAELAVELGLLGERTSAGRLQRAIALAMVKVLPLPVTPSSVWAR